MRPITWSRLQLVPAGISTANRSTPAHRRAQGQTRRPVDSAEGRRFWRSTVLKVDLHKFDFQKVKFPMVRVWLTFWNRPFTPSTSCKSTYRQIGPVRRQPSTSRPVGTLDPMRRRCAAVDPAAADITLYTRLQRVLFSTHSILHHSFLGFAIKKI